MLSSDAAYDALLARDPRFDGVFFVGVATTGIYCRPICPARTPGKTRCTFYATPAQAEHAGFRACFRCRPELAPGHAEVDAIDRLVRAAAQRINEGALNEDSVETLADELGVTARHLRRAVEAKLGVSPVELAQTRRLALAKQLLHDTSLPLAQIAFAAGFGSVRRFNALFSERMGTAPSDIRRTLPKTDGGAIALRLDYRPPLDFAQILAFLAMRAIPGVEQVDGDSYRRTVHVGKATGTIEVRALANRHALELVLAPSLLPVAMQVVARVRRLFDLDARPDIIDAALSRDPLLAPRVKARPGLRVPGAVDTFEASVRAMLGQQVSVKGATTLAGRFADKFGTRTDDGLLRFPTSAEVAKVSGASIAQIGMPGSRGEAIRELARALAEKRIDLDTPRDLDDAVASLVALPGIGPWTAHYLAMRALHLPDAFPAGDLGVRKALNMIPQKDAEARAEAWRPFRAYAVMHLWIGGEDQ